MLCCLRLAGVSGRLEELLGGLELVLGLLALLLVHRELLRVVALARRNLSQISKPTGTGLKLNHTYIPQQESSKKLRNVAKIFLIELGLVQEIKEGLKSRKHDRD